MAKVKIINIVFTAMVLLGLVFTLLKEIPRGAERGLYAGKGIMHGTKVTFSNKK